MSRLDLPRSEVVAPDGLLIVDKPAGVTSHDVVSGVRRLAATRKVGHAGTLDPMATGVLVLGIGKATRLLTFITGSDKDYEATVFLGVSTDTDDAEGNLLSRFEVEESSLDSEGVDRQLRDFLGEQMQVPSTVSAIKVNGKRAHALHREGGEVALQARPITISKLNRTSELRFVKHRTGSFGCEFDIAVTCSSGTYVRAIARDLGERLGVGAHLTRLRRTRVGKWSIGDARTLDSLSGFVRKQDKKHPAPIEVVSLTAACLQQFDRLDLTFSEARAMQHGNATKLAVRTPAGRIAACLWQDEVRALVKRSGNRYEPVLVFSTEPVQETQELFNG